MKILGIVGSKRKQGNTYNLVQQVLDGAESEGAETQLIFLGDYSIQGCTGCEGCKNTFRCIINDDMQKIYTLMDEADGLVLGSPTYWYNVTSDMKKFIDRCYSLIIFPEEDRSVWVSAYEDRGKCGVAVAVCEQTDKQMMGFTMDTLTMVMKDLHIRVADTVGGLKAFAPGEVLNDADLLKRAQEAGQRLITTLNMKNKAKDIKRY